jgi:SAM-dependent methyltransferase
MPRPPRPVRIRPEAPDTLNIGLVFCYDRAAAQAFRNRDFPIVLSDRKWQELLAKGGELDGVELPRLPPEELQTATVGSSGAATIRGAFRFYAHVLETARGLGRPIRHKSRVLDFGVGWGRTIRCFMRETKHLYGVDVEPRFLDAARETGCPATLSLISPRGSLPYRDETFDLVYAYSVFTHLPLPVQEHWLAEIRRVMAPTGMFVATVQPPRFLGQIAAVELDDPAVHPWLRKLRLALADDVDAPRRLAEEGYVYFGGESYGDTIMTSAFARERWGRHFLVTRYLDDAVKFRQAVIVAIAPSWRSRTLRIAGRLFSA